MRRTILRNLLLSVSFFAILIGSCLSCAHRSIMYPEWDRSDPDAAEAQDLMEETVKIYVKGTYKLPPVKIENKNVVPGVVPPPFTPPFNFDPFDEDQGLASGFVYNDAQLGSFIITAFHVCDVEKTSKTPFGEATLIKGSFSLVTVHDVTMKVEPIYSDTLNDICVMKPERNLLRGVSLASSLPPLGARVLAVGGPHGTFGVNLASVSDGRYSGLTNFKSKGGERTIFNTTAQVAQGASGSGIFYRGRLVGMVTHTYGVEASVMGGTPLRIIKDVIKIARGKVCGPCVTP